MSEPTSPLAETTLGRRRFLGIGLAAVSLPALLAACGGDDDAASGPTSTGSGSGGQSSDSTETRSETPSCTDGGADETISETEGPFFSSGSPERTSLLEDGIDGTRLSVTGVVMSTACAPLAGAKLDFWHADDDGEYDNEGYRLRGHQFTDAEGRWTLETIHPAIYPGRTRHIHVKVQREDGDVLTTQLYFPNEPENEGDDLFHEELLMDVQDAGDAKTGTFDFVLS